MVRLVINERWLCPTTIGRLGHACNMGILVAIAGGAHQIGSTKQRSSVPLSAEQPTPECTFDSVQRADSRGAMLTGMSSPAFQRLAQFLQNEMRMSHIYQPLMLKLLLEHDGRASTRDIAAAFLSHDESQLDYYETIANRMPGSVLRKHGLVSRDGDGYALAPTVQDLSDGERTELVQLCDDAIAAYKTKRGAAIWEHRTIGLGQIPGGLRYETLKRAGFRCELCGISADERALDVDHIIPRKHGGTDDPDNLQALCWLCNTNKGAGDDTDFRTIREGHALREKGCVFCELDEQRVVASNALAVAIDDRHPVTPLHSLVIPRRHVADYFDLHDSEVRAVHRLIEQVRQRIVDRDPSVRAFNIGVNSGPLAGQSVLHAHVHLIPRRAGDVANPRGGVRATIPGKCDYE